MSDRDGIFAGDDPFGIARRWLAEAEQSEANDPNAIALSTVDSDGLPNARMVLLKEIEAEAFVFYTNYDSAKARELDSAGKAAFVMHWKSLRRQIRDKTPAHPKTATLFYRHVVHGMQRLPHSSGAVATHPVQSPPSPRCLCAYPCGRKPDTPERQPQGQS